MVVHLQQRHVPWHLLHRIESYLAIWVPLLKRTPFEPVNVHDDLTADNILGRRPLAVLLKEAGLSRQKNAAIFTFCLEHEIQSVAQLLAASSDDDWMRWEEAGECHRSLRYHLLEHVQV
jgi:hypothetical protein